MFSVFTLDLRTGSIRAHAMSNVLTRLSTRKFAKKNEKYLVNMLNSPPIQKV